MKEYWLYGLFTAALANPPAHLKGQVEMLDGGGNYSTEIIPVVQGDKQYAQLAFCKVTGIRPGDERWITTPFATVTVAWPDKHIIWQDVRGRDFGLVSVHKKGTLTEYAGQMDRAGTTMAEFRQARSRYTPLVSMVIEREWLLTRHAVTDEERATARELQDCVRILYDKPLLPYYHHAGRQFFAWLERTAR